MKRTMLYLTEEGYELLRELKHTERLRSMGEALAVAAERVGRERFERMEVPVGTHGAKRAVTVAEGVLPGWLERALDGEEYTKTDLLEGLLREYRRLNLGQPKLTDSAGFDRADVLEKLLAGDEVSLLGKRYRLVEADDDRQYG